MPVTLRLFFGQNALTMFCLELCISVVVNVLFMFDCLCCFFKGLCCSMVMKHIYLYEIKDKCHFDLCGLKPYPLFDVEYPVGLC